MAASIVIFLWVMFHIGQGQQTDDCPLSWELYNDHCYHFVFAPHRSYLEAEKACIMDGASLVSVNDEGENSFIIQWLQKFTNTRLYSWYTSGVDRNGALEWEGDGSDVMQGDYWVHRQDQKSPEKLNLVYRFSADDVTFAWDWVRRNERINYICEIDRLEAFRINRPLRDYTYGLDMTDMTQTTKGPTFTMTTTSIVLTGREAIANLLCMADGFPFPTYRWFRNINTANETEVTSETDPRYTLTNGRLTFTDPNPKLDTGTYQCHVENKVGSVIGAPVEVTSGYLNEFVAVKPGVVRAKLYQGTQINCNTPEFNPKVRYQWYKNDAFHFIRPSLNPHTFISENGRLYISEVQRSDQGEYHCIVTLAAPYGLSLTTNQPPSRNSLGIGLIVTGENANDLGPDIHNDFPAIFPTPPQSGQQIRIECLAYGKLPLYYSWQKINGTLSTRVRFENLYRVLIISNATLEDSGTYRCNVKRGEASASKDIYMSVVSHPRFLFPLTDKYIDVNSQLTWRCEAVAVPRATYVWYKNTVPLMSLPGDVEIYRNTLIIRHADPDRHNGMYQCMAKNRFGTTFSGAELKVLRFKPSFTKSPVSMTMIGTIGGNVTLRCLPEAAPTPGITWSHNGRDLGLVLGSRGRLSMLMNGYLVISQTTHGDAGSYTCTATNSEGKAASTGHLTVVTSTVMSTKPSDTSVVVNETAFMFCEASYDVRMVDLVYDWLFEGRLIDIDSDPHFVQGVRNGERGLYIRNAQYKHAGRYTCNAVTVQDHVSAEATLRVYGQPGECAGVYAHQFHGQNVDLLWTPPVVTDTHAEPITQYMVQAANNYDGWDTWVALTEPLTDTETYIAEEPERRRTVITGLGPGTEYKFRVLAMNQFGWGIPSKPSIEYHQKSAPPSSAPQNVGGGDGKVGDITITWDAIPWKDRGGEKVGFRYKVRFRKLTPNRDGNWQTYDVDGAENVLVKQVGKENYYLQYETMVQGFNNLGEGPNSTIVIIYSAEEMPVTVPSKVWAQEINSTAAIAHWNKIPDTREIMKGRIRGFQINWWRADGIDTYSHAKYIRHYGDITQGLFIGLQDNTDYWVNVQVYNGAGLSNPSEKWWCSTYYNPPVHYPFFVEVRSHGPYSAYIQWRGISTAQNEESLSGFKVKFWQSRSPMSSAVDLKLGKTNHAVLQPIEKGVVYQVRVMATSFGGDGKKSPTVYFTLGGQVRINTQTSEILASGNKLEISIYVFMFCLVTSYFLLRFN